MYLNRCLGNFDPLNCSCDDFTPWAFMCGNVAMHCPLVALDYMELRGPDSSTAWFFPGATTPFLLRDSDGVPTHDICTHELAIWRVFLMIPFLR